MVQLCPSLDETPLPRGKRAGENLDGLEADHCFAFLVDRVEMGRLMSHAELGEHPDDDPKEPRDLRHS